MNKWLLFTSIGSIIISLGAPPVGLFLGYNLTGLAFFFIPVAFLAHILWIMTSPQDDDRGPNSRK